MGLETATYINGLDSANPTSSDPKSQGDDHLRLIKAVLLATFPNLSGAVTVTHTALNYIANVTSDIQAQLNARGIIAGQIWSGIHDFTSATLTSATQALGDISTKVATTQFAMTMQSPSFSGTPTAPTAPAGTSSTQIATTEFVTATSFSAILPAQTGNAGKFVTTDGTNASWAKLVETPAGAVIYTAQNFGGF